MFTLADVIAGQATHAAWLASVARQVARSRYLDSLPPDVAVEETELAYLERTGEARTLSWKVTRLRQVRLIGGVTS